MQQLIDDEIDEDDEIDIVAMNQVQVARDIDVWYLDEIELLQIDWIDEMVEPDDIDDEVVGEIIQDVQDLDDDEVDDDDISLETDENDEMRDEHQSEIWLQTDETDEMVEYSDVDEIDDNEPQQTILVVFDEPQNDETVETDTDDELVDLLDDDDLELIEANDEADETDETELFVDEIELEQILEVVVKFDDIEVVQSIICIDWYCIVANISIIVFKPNDEIDENDEVQHIDVLIEHHDDDIEIVEVVLLTDETCLLLISNCRNLEA